MLSLPRMRLLILERLVGCTQRKKQLRTRFFKAATVFAVATVAAGAAGQVAETASVNLNPPANSMQANAEAAPAQAAVQEHPLIPALRMAYATKASIDANVKDYSATIVKRERIDGKLGDPEYAMIKVRQQPFSVYMSFL